MADTKSCPTCAWVKNAGRHTHPRYLADVMSSPAYPHTCGREQKTCVGGCWKNNGEPCGDCPASRASIAALSSQSEAR